MAGHLPGKHGDSLDYGMINHLLITLSIGVVLGIILFGFVL